jgi:oligopeptide/dipeptide ABC transporter ATP-binding protein
VSFAIEAKQTFALVGESGSGKTTVVRNVLGIDHPTAGEILFRGRDIRSFDRKERRALRFSIQAVFQDPWSSLNPRMKAGAIITEPLRARSRLRPREVRARLRELLNSVGLPSTAAERYPHQFSGGQRQRIAIARALSAGPDLITLDEPVSSLDVSIRAQIMNLLKDVQAEHGVSYLLVGHHLGTVRYLSHQVGVMYLGKLVEHGPAAEVFSRPLHPYTQALLAASLPVRARTRRQEIVLPGEVPSPIRPPAGCAFHTRCPQAMSICSCVTPVLAPVSDGSEVACHLYPPPNSEPASMLSTLTAGNGDDGAALTARSGP